MNIQDMISQQTDSFIQSIKFLASNSEDASEVLRQVRDVLEIEVDDENENNPYELIRAELTRARKKWSWWPKDIIHQISIMTEEAGEATKAANEHVHEGKDYAEIKKELIQTAAMCVRCLEGK